MLYGGSASLTWKAESCISGGVDVRSRQGHPISNLPITIGRVQSVFACRRHFSTPRKRADLQFGPGFLPMALQTSQLCYVRF